MFADKSTTGKFIVTQALLSMHIISIRSEEMHIAIILI